MLRNLLFSEVVEGVANAELGDPRCKGGPEG
jgi:hypothetical protein